MTKYMFIHKIHLYINKEKIYMKNQNICTKLHELNYYWGGVSAKQIKKGKDSKQLNLGLIINKYIKLNIQKRFTYFFLKREFLKSKISRTNVNNFF